MISKTLFCVCALILAVTGFVTAAPGDLDPSFDTDGKVVTDISAGTDQAAAIAIQSDGKIVAAGVSFSDFAVARYKSDGSLDSTFGTGGIATYDFDGFPDRARGVAIQTDGKIVVVGEANVSAAQQFGVVRYNSNGTLDTGFGAGGVVTTDFATQNDYAYAVAIQSNGKIVVAGNVSVGGLFYFGLARYETNGALDGTFGTGGKVSNFTNGYAKAVAIQPDGKIVAGGTVQTGGSDPDFAIARYNSNGTLDTTFNASGEAATDFSGTGDSFEGLALQSDGKMLPREALSSVERMTSL